MRRQALDRAHPRPALPCISTTRVTARRNPLSELYRAGMGINWGLTKRANGENSAEKG